METLKWAFGKTAGNWVCAGFGNEKVFWGCILRAHPILWHVLPQEPHEVLRVKIQERSPQGSGTGDGSRVICEICPDHSP